MPFCLHSLVYHIPLFNAISYKAKKAVFPPLCVLAVTWNALILIFIYFLFITISRNPCLSVILPIYPALSRHIPCSTPL